MTARLALPFADPAQRAACLDVCRRVQAAGGRALLVGGSVRDALLGRPAQEADLEVFGLPPQDLRSLLAAHYGLDEVGRSFGVIKLRGLDIDVSVPRAGGDVREAAPDLDPETAARRRDFTLNAIAFDPLSDALIDPCDGQGDLRRRVLRHTSEHFGDDPLRVLRGMQLVARFALTPAPETLALCASLEEAGIARERVFEEWRKLVLLGVRPSLGLAFLRDCGWTRHTPELEALIGCPQDPEWHPEGDVWVHTLHCMDAFAGERVGDAREDLVVGLAVLCHDLGKPDTTRAEGGRITSKRHEPVGEACTRRFLGRMTDEAGLIDEVVPLVGAHLAPQQLFDARAGDAAVRRLARRVGRIDRLVRVASADQRGRPPRVVERFEAGEWLLARARALAVERAAPQPLVQGRHLIRLGLAPGPGFGPILEACFTAQLDGVFQDEAGGLAFAREEIARQAELSRR